MSIATRFVPRHINHHGSHSGYDRLFEHMGMERAENKWAMRLADMLPAALAWRLWAMRPQPTSAAGLRAELGAMPWLASGSGRLCHFIYGEDTYFFTPLWKRGANRCIATFHYPPQRLSTRINAGSVKLLDAAIIVGENQLEFLQQVLPVERIHYCPHPVDTEFFCPGEIDYEQTDSLPRLVCAGHLFRDYAALRDVHERVRRAGFDVQTDVIGPSEHQQALLDGATGIHVHRGVSDEELRELYRRATVGVLPLTDSTANNTLLEILACGRPVVASCVGGLPAYTSGSATRLVPPGDARSMAEHVCELLADRVSAAKEGLRNRAHTVEYFAYAPIAKRMRAIYATCHGT